MRPATRVLPRGQVLGSGVRPAAQEVVARTAGDISESDILRSLEEAGATLLAMPAKGYTTQMRQMRFDVVHTALEAYGWEAPALRAPMPSAAEISRMDQVFSWLALVPEESFLLRRILGARALVHPLTGRHLFAWRRLAKLLGADHKSVQRWHANGIKMLWEQLNRR
jgi:hypothetical protein